MTNITPGTIPAGWYPDPAGTPHSRWWDGAQWTDHFQQPYSTAANSSEPGRAPAGTRPYTVWAWLIIAVMLLQIVPLFFIDFTSALRDSATTGGYYSGTSVTSYPVQTPLSWLLIAALVLFAYLDWRALKSTGVPQPFHWAWSFFALLTPLVYAIGRTIVVRRRTGSGLALMFAAIGITVLSFMIGIALVLVPAMAIVQENR